MQCKFCSDEFGIFDCERCGNVLVVDQCEDCHDERVHCQIKIQNANLAGNSRVSHLDSIDNDPDGFGFADN